MRGLGDQILSHLADWKTSHKNAIVSAVKDGVKQTFKSVNVTSNSSGLINLTSLGVDPDNAWGITVSCSTSNYRVSNPILWSNGDYYVVLYNWNNASVVANKQVRLVLTWHYS